MDIRTSVPTIYGDHAEKFSELWSRQIAALRSKFGAAIETVLLPRENATDVPVVFVGRDQWVEVLRYLKTDSSCDYGFLADLTGTDELPEELRFHVVANLFSHTSKARIRVKTRVKEGQSVPTLCDVWPGANWAEREVFDMFGVVFEGHPDLRRILMDVRWTGYPLRKDYPLKGYQLFQTPEAIETRVLGD